MPTIEKIFKDFEQRLQRRARKQQRLSQVPSKKKYRPRCGADARSTGKPCQMKALANGRCRLHGGLSTGPKTEEGKARSRANLRQYKVPNP